MFIEYYVNSMGYYTHNTIKKVIKNSFKGKNDFNIEKYTNEYIINNLKMNITYHNKCDFIFNMFENIRVPILKERINSDKLFNSLYSQDSAIRDMLSICEGYHVEEDSLKDWTTLVNLHQYEFILDKIGDEYDTFTTLKEEYMHLDIRQKFDIEYLIKIPEDDNIFYDFIVNFEKYLK